MRCKLCNAILNDGDAICPICGFDNSGDPAEHELVSTHGTAPRDPAPAPPADSPELPAEQTAAPESDGEPSELVPVTGGGPPAETIPERGRRKRSPWPWIAGGAALLLILGALAWWFIGRPLTSPQMKLGTQVAAMFDGFFDMEGDEFLTRMIEDDHELTLTFPDAIQLPLPVAADITVTQAKSRTTEGLGASLMIDGVSYADISLLLREELLASVKYADVDAAFITEISGEPSDPVLDRLLAAHECDPETKQKFLTETGLLLYKNTDQKQFAVEAVGTFSRVTATFTADDLLTLSTALTEKLASAEYRAMAVEVIGADAVDKLMSLLDMAPTFLTTASDLTVTIESIVRENGGESLRVAVDLPGTFTMDAMLLRLAKDGTTTYELTVNDAVYSANFSFPADGVIDIYGMLGDSPYTVTLDTAETQPDRYAGTLALTLSNGILSGDAAVIFSSNESLLLAGYDTISASASESDSIAALLGDLIAAADIGRLLTLM